MKLNNVELDMLAHEHAGDDNGDDITGNLHFVHNDEKRTRRNSNTWRLIEETLEKKNLRRQIEDFYY